VRDIGGRAINVGAELVTAHIAAMRAVAYWSGCGRDRGSVFVRYNAPRGGEGRGLEGRGEQGGRRGGVVG
jgi:hypothetical protein